MYIKPMTFEEFFEHIHGMKEGELTKFYLGYALLDGEEIPYDIESFIDAYFAKMMSVSEYGNRFILIDDIIGGHAFAIPLNSIPEEGDEITQDDVVKEKKTAIAYLEACFHIYSNLGNAGIVVNRDSVLYVEIDGACAEDEERLRESGERIVQCTQDYLRLWSSGCYYTIYGRFENRNRWLIDSDSSLNHIYDDELACYFRECGKEE